MKKGERAHRKAGWITSFQPSRPARLVAGVYILAGDGAVRNATWLVLSEANAIGTVYLRTQLLPEPHRARISDLVVRYTDNRIALAKSPRGSVPPLLAQNDALITDLWAATSAAFPSISNLDFSSAYLDSMNDLIDLDMSRKMARIARVPPQVFAVLFLYVIATAGVTSYLMRGPRSIPRRGLLFLMIALSLLLIIDIDRPGDGGIVEGQLPMEVLRASFNERPPQAFDHWRAPPPALKPSRH